jgi:hypothetical protein
MKTKYELPKRVFLRYEYEDEILPYLEVVEFNISLNNQPQLYHSYSIGSFMPSGINLPQNKNTIKFKVKKTEFNKQILDSYLNSESNNFYKRFKLKIFLFEDVIFDESNYDENFINEYYCQENQVENCMMESINFEDDGYPEINIVGY